MNQLEGVKLVFVQSIAQSALLRNHFKQVIELNRDTFPMEYPKIIAAPEEYKVILATDIAEMGCNIHVDHVIDIGETYKPKLVVTGRTQSVSLELMPTTKTAKIQRRGRTGRTSPGTYTRLASAYSTDDTVINWIEAQMLLDNLPTPIPLMEEEAFLGSTIGAYTLSDPQKTTFFYGVNYSNIEMSIWLSFQLARNGLNLNDTSWLFNGTGQTHDIKIPGSGNAKLSTKPLFFDDRFFSTNKSAVIHKYAIKNKPHAVRSNSVYSIFDNAYGRVLRNTINKASEMFLNDGLTDEDIAASTTALYAILSMSATLLFVIIITISCCCKTVKRVEYQHMVTAVGWF